MGKSIERARAGDRAAFDELVEQHRVRLQNWIASRLGPRLRGRVDVEDVVQETSLRAFQAIPRFRPRNDDSFYNWLCAIAENQIWNAAKRRSSRETSLVHDVASQHVSPSRALRREERLERLKDALQHLKPEQRRAVELAKIDGLKVREIAVRMSRSEDSVKQLLSRGLRQLKETFGDTESLHLPQQAPRKQVDDVE